MKVAAELQPDYSELAFLMRGCPPETPIRQNTYLRSPEKFQAQLESMEASRSNARVVAVVALGMDVVLVKRTTKRKGFALPSGSIHTWLKESILDAGDRELREEANVKPKDLRVQDVEIRTFEEVGTGRTKHIVVGVVAGLLAEEQREEVKLTPDGVLEKLAAVGLYHADALPPLAFGGDHSQIELALGRAA